MKGEHARRARYAILIVLVVVVCYLLGTVSVLFARHATSPPIVVEENLFSHNSTTRESEAQDVRQFVASKNSDIFYPTSCSYAQRIQEQNRVYFATEEDALKDGFIHSKGCFEVRESM